MSSVGKDYHNDTRKLIKRFMLYLAIIFFVFIITSTVFTILKIQVWAIMLFNVVFGGGIVFLIEMIYRKKQNKKQVEKLMSDKQDPFA